MAVNTDKLKVLIGNLGDEARAGMLAIGEKLGLYRARPKGPSELTRVGTDGEDITCSKGKHSGTKTSGNYVTGWRKRYQPVVLIRRLIAAAVLTCLLYTPSQSYSECTSNYEERVALELSALGKRGDAIARAREQVLEILQPGNACAAWFQEANSDPAGVFRSVHFELESGGTSYAYSLRDRERGQLFKQPWAARTTQNAGRNAIIQLNGNGPFFNSTSLLMQLDPGGKLALPGGSLILTVSRYPGDTPEAQITILLHELGHIIGRLPEDDDSWDGRSFRNTFEVSRHCKTETRAAARNGARGGIRAHNPDHSPGNECRPAYDKRPEGGGNRFLRLCRWRIFREEGLTVLGQGHSCAGLQGSPANQEPKTR